MNAQSDLAGRIFVWRLDNICKNKIDKENKKKKGVSSLFLE